MRSKVDRIAIFILTFLFTVAVLISLELHRQDEANISTLIEQNTSMQEEIAELNELQVVSDELIQTQAELIDELFLPPDELPAEKSDRGTERGSPRIMEVTAYDLSVESCGKKPSHPLYGITASGVKVQEWHTIAAGPELPIGTEVYIPYFKDKPNGGIFVVEDRGGAIKNGRLDVYIADNAECFEFGRRELEVYILD